MRQWTTPTNTFDVDVDLTECEVIFLTYQQGGRTIFEKTKEDMTITEDTVSVKLTQEETGMMNSNIPLEMQFRARYADGTAIESNTICSDVGRALKQGEI